MPVKNPAFWLRFDHRKVPDGQGTDIYRWARRPYADMPLSGGYKEGRVEDFGTIERHLTDSVGGYRPGGFRCSLSDLDRFFRIVLGTNASQFAINREVSLELLSNDGQRNGDEPRCIYRGIVDDHPLSLGLKFAVEGQDFIGSRFSPLALNQFFPRRTWNRSDFNNMHRDLIGTPQQIPYGIISDEGAVDTDGLNAEKGRHPVVWLGYDYGIGYHVFGVAGCAIKSINQWYASDLATDTTPDRVRMETSTAGVDFLLPGWPGWPHPDPFIEVNGQRMTIIYAAGPRAEHHINGFVNITLNICGIEDVGDSTGAVITQMFPQIQHLFEQWICANNGMGYMTGNWAAEPEWPTSGLSIIKSSTFAESQDKTKVFLGDDVGYEGVFDLTEFATLLDLIRYASLSSGAFLGVDWDGRLMAKILDDVINPEEGLHIREKIEAIEFEPPKYAFNETENRILYQYAWDNDKQRFSADIEEMNAFDAQHEVGGVYQPQTPHPLRFVGHTRVARDVMARRLLRLKYPPKYQRATVNLCGLDTDLGNQIRYTVKAEGLGIDGEINRPHFITDMSLNPNNGEIKINALDRSQIQGSIALLVTQNGVIVPSTNWTLGAGPAIIIPPGDAGPGGSGQPGAGGAGGLSGVPGNITSGDFYVDVNRGSDSNLGTSPDVAFRTLGFALSVASPGDIIVVRGGIYSEFIDDPGVSGSVGNPITVASYADEVVWLKPTFLRTGDQDVVFYIPNGRSYLEFDGINIDASAGRLINLVVDTGAHHITWRNFQFIGNRLPGDLSTSTQPLNVRGDNNAFYNFGIRGGAGNNANYGAYIHGNNNLFDGFDIYDMGYQGFQIYDSGTTPADNVLRNFKIHDIVTGLDDRRNGIIIKGLRTKVSNGVIWNILTPDDSGTGVSFFEGSDNKGAFLTLVNIDGKPINIDSGVTNTEVKNDIGYQTADVYTNAGTGTVASNNLFDGSDPKFVSIAGRDFRLNTDSPARDTGVVVAYETEDIVGVARGTSPDKGAYEYAAP